MNPTTDSIPTKLVTLACDATWRPVKPSFQHADNKGQFTAKLLTLAVADDDGEILFYGFETRRAASIFAASLGSKATIVTVEPYWHVASFGCIAGYELTEPTEPAPTKAQIDGVVAFLSTRGDAELAAMGVSRAKVEAADSIHRISWRAAGLVSVEYWQSDRYYFELISTGARRWYFWTTSIDGVMGAKSSGDYTSRAACLNAMRVFAAGYSQKAVA